MYATTHHIYEHDEVVVDFADGECVHTQRYYKDTPRNWHWLDRLVFVPVFWLMALLSARFNERWPYVSFVSALTARPYFSLFRSEKTEVHELRHLVQIRRYGKLGQILRVLWPPSMVRLEAEAYFFDGSSAERTAASLEGGAYLLLLGRRRTRRIINETFAYWRAKIQEEE